MDWRVSPCWHFSLPTLLSFSSMFVGKGDGSFPPTFTPAQIFPCPPLSHRRQRKGGGVGGQGSPSVLRLHRVFRLNQEIFYYQKEKRKKKSQRPPVLPAPWGQPRPALWGPREAAQGWSALRQEWWGPVRPSARPALGLSPLLLSFPSEQTTRGGLPLTSGPWAGAWGAGGWGRGAAQP